MTPEVSERAFEAAIEEALLRGGPDAPAPDGTELREPAVTDMVARFGGEPLPVRRGYPR